MSEECGSCEYNRQCFIKKNVGMFECEKEIVNSEEIKEVIEALPKTNNTISAYGSIDINELYKTIEKFKKVPDYNELMKDNNNLQQKVEQLENENFNIRENIHLERISLPPELTKDKDFMELYDIPSYEDLKNKVEQLEKENKILKENAEHNDKVVDKVNWENMLLKGKINESITLIKQLKGSARYQRCMYELDYLLDELSKKVGKNE